MNLVSPIWLIGLAPWVGVFIYLLRGARERANVPFLELWRAPVALPRQERRWRFPPIGIVLLMLGCLLGILAASRPNIVIGAGRLGSGVSLVIDRGMTMSGRGAGGPRFRETALAVSEALKKQFSAGEVELVVVPGEASRKVSLANLAGEIGSIAPTSCDTHRALTDVIAAQSMGEGKTTLVVTDQAVGMKGSGVIAIAPGQPVQDVGIIRLAVRERPTTQAMVGVRNHSGRTRGVLKVTSGARPIERQIDLPPKGAEQNYFIELPVLGEVIEARLGDADDIQADDAAWLVREGASPQLEPRTVLPAAVRRMIQAYQHARPAEGAGALPVIIVGEVEALPAGGPAIVLGNTDHEISRAEIRAEDHPITRNVHWPGPGGAVRGGGVAPKGWTPLVEAGDEVMVAINPGEPRRVWVGFDAPQWTTTTDFVVLWTNVFDWTGGGQEAARWRGHSLTEWQPEWKLEKGESGLWPGVYVRSDGARRAFNPPDVATNGEPTEDWRRQIAGMTGRKGGIDLTSALLLAALACVTIAALGWRG